MSETWLTVRTPNRRVLTVLLDGSLVLGRDCDGLILADQRVSRRHTSLEPVEDRVLVTDLDSSNGTTLNGELITEPTVADAGDMVTIGATMVSIHTRDRGEDPIRSIPTELNTPSDLSIKTSIELVADAVDDDIKTTGIGANIRAEIIGAEDEPGTLTVVFSDIEASTELAVAMGDTDWFEILRHHHQLVSAHVDAHKGRIVKNQGDGYMICFRSARQALLACIGMQRDLERLGSTMLNPKMVTQLSTTTGAEALRVRMGAHTGEVMMQDDGDLFGKHVIVAARIGALAGGGQILVSSLVKQIAEPRGDIPFGPPYETQLKGIDGLAVIHDVDWAAYVDNATPQ